MEQQELIPHLFRTESGKITSVLCNLFGIGHIQTAEDIAAETFLAALETWTYKGIPENPVAWLYTVAKNKAKNYLAHRKVFDQKIGPHLQTNTDATEEIQADLSDANISDSQLRMLFAICHPSVSAESQIALALRILCGFGIDEIAHAFLTNKETINKRLLRAKEKLREEKISLDLPPQKEIGARLQNVLTTLYLLFSEGYYSETNENIIRKDLCLEAMRLTLILTRNELTDLPDTNALLALMCFHVSRLDARKNTGGEMVLYQDQDAGLWDRELILKGAEYLHRASTGNRLSRYHLEATIAYWHTIKEDSAEKWENILQLYNQLLRIQYSPVAALNRTYALSKRRGNEYAIREAEKLQLHSNQYYFALLGELYSSVDTARSKFNFEKALSMAKTNAEKQALQKKLDALGSADLS
jgi:RNA polymerase sigma factor (sigma-70 family)